MERDGSLLYYRIRSEIRLIIIGMFLKIEVGKAGYSLTPWNEKKWWNPASVIRDQKFTIFHPDELRNTWRTFEWIDSIQLRNARIKKNGSFHFPLKRSMLWFHFLKFFLSSTKLRVPISNIEPMSQWETNFTLLENQNYCYV